MKKLKENVHAIQVGCQNCQGPHLDKDCPLGEEVKSTKEVKYGEFNKPFDGRFNKGNSNYNPQPSERRPSLTEIMNKFMNETTKRHDEQDGWLKFFYQSTKSSRNTHNKIIQDLDSRVKNLAKKVNEQTPKEEPEECKVIYSADGIPLYIPFKYSPKEIEYFAAHLEFSNFKEPKILKSKKKETLEKLEAITKTKQKVSHYIEPYEPPIPYPRRLEQHAEEALVNKTMENLVADIQKIEEEEIKMNPRCSAFLNNQFPPKEQDPRSFILLCSIGKQDFSNALADIGASISLMPLSLYKQLGIRKLDPYNMVIELVNNSKRTAHGVVENLLIKIDKFIFPVDFVILGMVEDPRMPIILGRPLLATVHASVDNFRKSISLEVGMSCKEWMRVKYGKTSKTTQDMIMKDYWRNEIEKEEEDNLIIQEECEENKDVAMLKAIYDKLDDDWFQDSSEDEKDLIGILDYLEPNSYNRFTNYENKAYNKRKCELLGDMSLFQEATREAIGNKHVFRQKAWDLDMESWKSRKVNKEEITA
ncbi:zinc knuckle CX2CX4HX4C containing protein [Tanacetum coccineum]|uniref:Zinc knuckle CX2CX4HX4C containing protein n=1 Tax=Tanacetum coccineum TaxID=301880 RepID=A0ABQ5DP11_9ASTR